MHVIRTSAEMASLCQLSLDPELLSLLTPYAEAVEEFGDDLAAIILIVEQGDTFSEAEAALGRTLLADGKLAFTAEIVAEHMKYLEITVVEADFGDGFVLLADKKASAELLIASRLAIALGGDFP